MLGHSGSLPRAATAQIAAASTPSRSAHLDVAEPMEQDETSWVRRVRSAVLLAALIGVLGVITAATLGVLVVTLTSLIDQALG